MIPTEPYWYLAGKMSGIPAFNFPMFDLYAKTLRENGYTIVNPAELDHEEGRKAALASTDGDPSHPLTDIWLECLRRDLDYVLHDNCIGVLAMPGWVDSAGARWETDAAQRARKEVCEVYIQGDDEVEIMAIERDLILARHGKLSEISMERLAAAAGIIMEGAWA